MQDPRLDRLARLIVGYSIGLREGDLVCFEGAVAASPLLLALYREALACGARPYTSVRLPELTELLVAEGSDEQLDYVPTTRWNEIERLDALVTIWSEENTRALASTDPARHGRHLATGRRVSNRVWERIAAGEMRWCGTLHPTNAHAQDADMSLAEYESFVFGACHVEDAAEDAVAHWRATAAELNARARQLERVRELRIVGPDTDLTVGVAGRTWLAADGHFNLPDGEVFTSPVETATTGEIRFQLPAIFAGREVEDVRLRFAGGRVVAAEAARGGDDLAALLDLEGARILGEVAFGLNYEIDRFTRNILFDEKIGGTVHVALGSGFAQAGGENRAGLHWDLICDLRAGGEVYADGELVWRAGRFLEPASADV